MFPRYLQRAFFQRLQVCVFFNMLLCFFYTSDKLNVSFGTILRGDSTLNEIFVDLWYSRTIIRWKSFWKKKNDIAFPAETPYYLSIRSDSCT